MHKPISLPSVNGKGNCEIISNAMEIIKIGIRQTWHFLPPNS